MHTKNKKFKFNDYLAFGVILEIVVATIHKLIYPLPNFIFLPLMGIALLLIIFGMWKGKE